MLWKLFVSALLASRLVMAAPLAAFDDTSIQARSDIAVNVDARDLADITADLDVNTQAILAGLNDIIDDILTKRETDFGEFDNAHMWRNKDKRAVVEKSEKRASNVGVDLGVAGTAVNANLNNLLNAVSTLLSKLLGIKVSLKEKRDGSVIVTVDKVLDAVSTLLGHLISIKLTNGANTKRASGVDLGALGLGVDVNLDNILKVVSGILKKLLGISINGKEKRDLDIDLAGIQVDLNALADLLGLAHVDI